MIGARLFGAILASGLLIATGNVHGRKVTYWNTRHRSDGAQHDPERVARAEAKREMRRAKVRRAVAAGGYGPHPYIVKASVQ